MYKDKDKQREAVKLAVRRHRANHKGHAVIPDKDVIPLDAKPVIPKQSYNPMMVGYVPPIKAG